jgi:hypothetical protein
MHACLHQLELVPVVVPVDSWHRKRAPWTGHACVLERSAAMEDTRCAGVA